MATFAELHHKIDSLQDAIADRDSIIEGLEKTIVQLNEELTRREVDELTGMYTLRWLREFWSSLRTPAQKIGAIAFIDIDLLKRVNDTYGHKTGDRVITSVAAAISASGGYGVRYGGDEFLLLIPTELDPRATLESIVDKISASPIPTRDGKITVVASCGARIVREDLELHQMIQEADEAMYSIKRSRSGAFGVRIVD